MRLTLFLALGASTAVAAIAACSSFESDIESGVADLGDAATATDVRPAADADTQPDDAGARPFRCTTYGRTDAGFCDDFDGPPYEANWLAPVPYGDAGAEFAFIDGGDIAPSPPRVLLARLPAHGNGAAGIRPRMRIDTAKGVDCELAIKLTEIAPQESVAVLSVYFLENEQLREITLTVASDQSEVYVTRAADAGTTSQLTLPSILGRWVKVRVRAARGEVPSLQLDQSLPVTQNERLSSSFAVGDVYLGVITTKENGGGGAAVYFDDVRCTLF